MNLFDIPVSALRASQAGMTAISGNLANAATPGYHRQVAHLSETVGAEVANIRIGAGVEVNNVQRMRSVWVERSLLRNNSANGSAEVRNDVAHQLDTLFQVTDGSLTSRVEDFFNSWQDLSSQPGETTVRYDLLATAASLTSEVNALHSRMAELSLDLDTQIRDTVKTINQITSNIAILNKDIAVSEASGKEANDLRDKRDLLVSQLAEYIDVSSHETTGQPHVFSAANGAMLITTNAPKLDVVQTNGKYQLTIDGWTSPLPAGSGKLQGLLESKNVIVGGMQKRLETFAYDLVRTADQLHAQGLGLGGPFTSLNGERGVSDATIPLAKSALDFPVTNGVLTVTVTDQATGGRTAYAVNIEPAIDSLNDVAAKLNAIPNLRATVSAQTGRLTIISNDGYGFDFTNQPPTQPDTTAWTGSSGIKIDGAYTGSANANWTIKTSGPGTIGVTPGLRAQVVDSSGNLVGDWNVGLGYSAGDALTTSKGVTVSFGSGTVAGTDTATLRVTADSDETGILSTLGLNSLFTGTSAANFSVRQDLMDNPALLAAGQSTRSGDNSNATAFAALANALIADRGSLTFLESLAQMTADAGSFVQTVTREMDQLGAIKSDLTAQQQAVSGVDPNEELVKLLEFQRMFQAASKYITTVNSALDSLFGIFR
ncbi:Flagellar hook-associated protein 1 [Caulifigura coniformis]|uniref:Flagellar hook-associated protein 1 n=1 Tax=Caulifigura coniformis TaxID=2527983 RepID=A0A517SJE1_9PLAN|nr:flagellar hook-associated protein FlgK [Caulifigura coniformis]QDT56235.1 Flagellar hook-associated protein 1 [Caulifigura coniformis]